VILLTVDQKENDLSVEKLLEAMKKAPKDKEVTFKVSTMISILEYLIETRTMVSEASDVDVNEIKSSVREEILQEKADSILF
jgi:hypothetical protein